MGRKEKPGICSIIVAAGKGTRMNMDKNKQYIEIGNKPVLARTLQVFEDCRDINGIILVVNSEDIVYCKQSIIDEFGFEKVLAIVGGGSTRQQSVFNGLMSVPEGMDIVMIHDGARPFLGEDAIQESIFAALEFGACCVAVPVKDTIKQADENGFVEKTLPRERIWSIQTPQTFRLPLILEAHSRALKEGYLGTDDAMLVEHMGHKLKLVMGSYENIKITTQEDLKFAEALIR